MVLLGTGGGPRESGNAIVGSALLPEEEKADRDTHGAGRGLVDIFSVSFGLEGSPHNLSFIPHHQLRMTRYFCLTCFLLVYFDLFISSFLPFFFIYVCLSLCVCFLFSLMLFWFSFCLVVLKRERKNTKLGGWRGGKYPEERK